MGLLSFLTLFCFCSLALPSYGQEAWHPLETANTSSPRDTLRSFLEGWGDLYQMLLKNKEFAEQTQSAANQILSCMDLRDIPPAVRLSVASESAVCLKEVLDRLELPPLEEIPDSEQITDTADNEPIERWRIPGTDITIARVPDGPMKGEYLFHPETVDRASDFYSQVKHLPYVNNDTPGIYVWFLSDAGWMIPDGWIRSLPDWTRKTVMRTPVWKWFGLVVVVIALVFVMMIIYQMGRNVAQTALETSRLGYVLSLVFPIAAISIPLFADYLVTHQLKLRGSTLNFVTISLDLIFLLSVIVVVLSLSTRISATIISHPGIHPRGLDAQFIRVTCRLLGLIAAVVIFLEGGKQLGIPFTTLIAGAGVGGLAFALAAQDAIKNLFGSMMIFLDKPYRVGERIVTSGFDGVVEEIGLRSTKIRLLTGHQVTIPNEDMARSHIENIGRRPHIRRCTDLALELSTPPELANKAVKLIQGLLENHEGMDPEFPPRVFFDEFNRDSLRIRILYWYHPPNYWEFVAFGEQLNLRIMEALNAEGIRLALPASETHFSSEDLRSLTSLDEPTDPASHNEGQ